MRPEDHEGVDFETLRHPKDPPDAQIFLEPGNILIPVSSTAIGAVVASTVVVTMFDPFAKRGGLCHFLRPRHLPPQEPTPIFGFPAILALLQEFLRAGSPVPSLMAGLYGGSSPDWANTEQRQVAQDNIEIAQEVLNKKKVPIVDIDVGGSRGRKLWFLSGTNEVLIAKTDAIRRSDWFPILPK